MNSRVARKVGIVPYLSLALGGWVLPEFSPAARADLLGPTPYRQFADSPFAGMAFADFHLEDFEDGTLEPGLSLTGDGGVWSPLGPSTLTDSVDADDGSIDGNGTDSSSLFSNGANTSLEVSFDAGVLGHLPTAVGIVWTDVGDASLSLGSANVTFEAFNAADVSLGVVGPFLLGDGSAAGGTAEDRFFGATDPSGIRRFVIQIPDSVDWEVDHVQFGLALSQVPEASAITGTLPLLVLTMGTWIYRRASLRHRSLVL